MLQTPAPVRGRKRSTHVDEAIKEATRTVLLEVGYTHASVEEIARRAGVGKAAIYRRWPAKADLVFACVVHDLSLEAPPDSGSLRGDLTQLLHRLHHTLSEPLARQVVPGLMSDISAADALLRQRFQDTFVAHQRECLKEVLERAVKRGELSQLPDPTLLHALLLGPIYVMRYAFFTEFDTVGIDNLADQLTAVVMA